MKKLYAMKKNRKIGDKGFSLVELIIVIAIMAILVGAIAPQVIKYVEKARESKDIQLESTIATALQTAIASSSTTVGSFTVTSIEDTTNTEYAKVKVEFLSLLGSDKDTDVEINKLFGSKKATTAPAILTVELTTTGSVKVTKGSLTPVENK